MPTLIPMPSPSPVIKLTLVGSLLGQTILNDMHWLLDSVVDVNVDYRTYLDDVHEQFDTPVIGLYQRWLEVMPSNYELVSARLQVVQPTRTRFVDEAIGNPGLLADPATTANVAMSIKRVAAVPGRTGVGRMQLVIPNEVIQGGEIDQAYYVGALDNWRQHMEAEFTTATPAATWVPVIFGVNSFGVAHWSPVISTAVLPTVRTMRRRTVGLGI